MLESLIEVCQYYFSKIKMRLTIYFLSQIVNTIQERSKCYSTNEQINDTIRAKRDKKLRLSILLNPTKIEKLRLKYNQYSLISHIDCFSHFKEQFNQSFLYLYSCYYIVENALLKFIFSFLLKYIFSKPLLLFLFLSVNFSYSQERHWGDDSRP